METQQAKTNEAATLKPQVFVYRAFCDHGKAIALVVDEPEIIKGYADEMAEWLKGGLHIERVTADEARKSDMFCSECGVSKIPKQAE